MPSCGAQTAPKEAGRMSFLVSAFGQGENEVIEIDDASLLELPAEGGGKKAESGK